MQAKRATKTIFQLSMCLSFFVWSTFSLANNGYDLSKAVAADTVSLNTQQIATIKNKKLTAALAWHGASPWVSAVTKGAQDTFEQLGIKVIAVTDAQFDPAKQVADLENISALSPDLLLSLTVDSVSTKNTYAQVVKQGTKLVLLSNPIQGFVHQKDYVGIVTDDMIGMGKAAGSALVKATPRKANIGVIYHDADYFITNTRDKAFRESLSQNTSLSVVSEKGFIRESDTNAIAAAMVLQHPNIQAIYVSWDAAAEGVIEALRSLDRRDIKVFTHDLGVNNLLDMATNGSLHTTISDRPYDIGKTMALMAAGATLGERYPQVTLVPFDTVTKTNIAQIWQQAYKSPLPKLLNQALAQ